MPLENFAYTLGEVLADGAFSVVFESVTAYGRPAIVKVARQHGGDRPPSEDGRFPARGFRDGGSPGTIWQRHVFAENEVADVLEAEAEVLSRAGGNRFPHLLDRTEVDGRPALVLEKLRRPWDLAAAPPQTFARLLEAAGDLTRAGIDCHGDLKPEHVFMDGRNEFAFIDPAYYRTTPPLRVATPEFNPRLLAGPASDVMAVAVMAYLRFAGELPQMTDRRAVPPLLASVSPAPGGLAEWVDALVRAPDEESLPTWANDHFDAAAALREGLDRPVVESAVFVIPRTTTHVAAHIPYGWDVTETWTLTAPRGQSDIVVECEELDSPLDTHRFAEVRGEALRGLWGYREHSLETVVVRSGHDALVRDYEFNAPDGHAVHQLQLYIAADGRGVTVTATSPSAGFDDVHLDFLAVFQSLTFS
jgi:hypothetical protein